MWVGSSNFYTVVSMWLEGLKHISKLDCKLCGFPQDAW
jgi:hypothetical protein